MLGDINSGQRKQKTWYIPAFLENLTFSDLFSALVVEACFCIMSHNGGHLLILTLYCDVGINRRYTPSSCNFLDIVADWMPCGTLLRPQWSEILLWAGSSMKPSCSHHAPIPSAA